jgi:hypothetical protein
VTSCFLLLLLLARIRQEVLLPVFFALQSTNLNAALPLLLLLFIHHPPQQRSRCKYKSVAGTASSSLPLAC